MRLFAQPVSRDDRKILADFEDSTTASWRALGDQPDARPVLQIGQVELPHTADSRSLPPASVQVRPYLRRLEFWLYGNGVTDELYADFEDQNKSRFRVLAARTNFQGWKLITVHPTPQMVQRAATITGEGGLVFLGFYVRPHYTGGSGLCSIHIDTLSAVVRPYQLRPDPDWK
ncbi:MAG: hypothetical protein HY042_07585 [Spirochaetia bacterium]|nr:hypothetical protein [Spirochaetia bacterium]